MDKLLSVTGLKGQTITRMANSFSNEVYRAEESNVILKIFRNERKWHVERYVTKLLQGHGIPTADILAAGECEGEFWVVQPYLQGINLQDALEAAPDHVFKQAGAMLARLHQISFPAYGLLGPAGLYETYTDWQEQCRARLAKFLDHPAMCRYLTDSERQAGWRFFESVRHVLRGGYPCLCHRDFRPGNLLVDPVRFTITAVIDFEAVQVCEPALDFAKVMMEFYGHRPDCKPHFEAGYASVRPLSDRTEMELHDFTHAVGGILWAQEHGDQAFLERNLAQARRYLG